MRVIRLHDLSKVPASHEDPVDPGVLKQILLRREDLSPGRIQMINWSTLLPCKSFRPHYHEAMDEVFIILDGDVEITVGEVAEVLKKGDAVIITEGTVHVMKNLTDEEVSYIAIGIARNSSDNTINV